MTRIVPVLAALAAVAGCVTTYKMWTESDADQQQGMVKLSYQYRNFENPQVDERAGIQAARERCRDWGFKDARRKAEERTCVDGVPNDCSKWQVTREYACERTLVQ